MSHTNSGRKIITLFKSQSGFLTLNGYSWFVEMNLKTLIMIKICMIGLNYKMLGEGGTLVAINLITSEREQESNQEFYQEKQI